MQNVDRDEAEQQGQRGHDLEIDEGFCSDSADLVDVSHACDADYDRGKDDGREGHPDQLYEGVAEWLQSHREVWKQYADRDAQDDSDHHLQPQRAEQGPATRHADGFDGFLNDHVYSA